MFVRPSDTTSKSADCSSKAWANNRRRSACGLVILRVHQRGSRSHGSSAWVGRVWERGRIHGRHPDSSLVDFEKLANKVVEIDVSLGEEVER